MKRYFFIVVLYGTSLIPSEEFKTEINTQLYEDIKQDPDAIESLDPVVLINFLYTFDNLCKEDEQEELYFQAFIKKILTRFVLLYQQELSFLESEDTPIVDTEYIRFIQEKLSFCAKHIKQYLQHYFCSIKDNAEQLFVKTFSYLSAEYDESEPVRVIKYGRKLQKYKEKRKQRKKESLQKKLLQKKDALEKCIKELSCARKLYKASWTGYSLTGFSYLDDIHRLEEKEKQLLEKVKEIKREISVFNFMGVPAWLSHDRDDTYCELYCDGCSKKVIEYFSDKVSIYRSVKVFNDCSRVSNKYFAVQEGKKKEIKKVPFFRNNTIEQRYCFGNYQVSNAKKFEGRLFAELYKDGELLLSSEYDNENDKVIISPEGSQVAVIDFNQEVINVYNLVEKMHEFKKYVPIDESIITLYSLVDLYTQYRQVELQK